MPSRFERNCINISLGSCYSVKMGKKIVITTFGSIGDLNPYIALARALKVRAHSPTIATSELYRETVEKAGIGFYPVRPDIDPDDYELVRRIMDPKTGPEILIKQVLLPRLSESYRDLLEVSAGSDLLITHPITFAGPLVAEKTGIRWISTVLAPLSFFSAYDLPVFAPYPYLKKLDFLRPWTGKLFLKFGRFVTWDWSAPVRQIRSEIGLPPGKDPIYEGQFSPEMTLGLFSPLLAKHGSAAPAASPPDWPQNTRVTGFVFHDEPVKRGAEDTESTRRCEEFLDAGPPPVVFTLGSSAVMAAEEFYRHSFEAARTLGIRAILLTGRDTDNRPAEPLPDEIAVFDYVPYSKIFPRSAAIVHHGGVGTSAQALKAGKPMLVVPFAFDQPDNAFRLTRLGVGRTLYRNRYCAHRAARELKILLEHPAYAKKAQRAGIALRSERGLEAACDAIEEVVG